MPTSVVMNTSVLPQRAREGNGSNTSPVILRERRPDASRPVGEGAAIQPTDRKGILEFGPSPALEARPLPDRERRGKIRDSSLRSRMTQREKDARNRRAKFSLESRTLTYRRDAAGRLFRKITGEVRVGRASAPTSSNRDEVPRLLLSLGAAVTPAQGSVKPRWVSHSIKLFPSSARSVRFAPWPGLAGLLRRRASRRRRRAERSG